MKLPQHSRICLRVNSTGRLKATLRMVDKGWEEKKKEWLTSRQSMITGAGYFSKLLGLGKEKNSWQILF